MLTGFVCFYHVQTLAMKNGISTCLTASLLQMFSLFFLAASYYGAGSNVTLPQVLGVFCVVVGLACSYLTIADYSDFN
jgi:hypothetical protein